MAGSLLDQFLNLPFNADRLACSCLLLVLLLCQLHRIDDLLALEFLGDSLDYELSHRIELSFALSFIIVVHQL